ncbi:MAG: GNAT family N-acetyltransferase [bacterium]
MIRPMKIEDVNQIVTVHILSFKGFFLSFLGPRFLSLYYLGICSATEGISFVYLNPLGKPVGFVAGSSNPRGFYSRLLKRDWLRFSLASLGAILKNPRIIRRLVKALFHPSGNPIGDEVAGLFSVGVLPELQGTGIGKKLVLSFLDEAKRRNCKKVFLTTDRDGNDMVNSFYQKLGFHIEREYETPEGRMMNEYWVEL